MIRRPPASPKTDRFGSSTSFALTASASRHTPRTSATSSLASAFRSTIRSPRNPRTRTREPSSKRATRSMPSPCRDSRAAMRCGSRFSGVGVGVGSCVGVGAGVGTGAAARRTPRSRPPVIEVPLPRHASRLSGSSGVTRRRRARAARAARAAAARFLLGFGGAPAPGSATTDAGAPSPPFFFLEGKRGPVQPGRTSPNNESSLASAAALPHSLSKKISSNPLLIRSPESAWNACARRAASEPSRTPRPR